MEPQPAEEAEAHRAAEGEEPPHEEEAEESRELKAEEGTRPVPERREAEYIEGER